MLASKVQLAAFHDFFAEHGSHLQYRKNDFIIRPGETPSGVFFITDGLVKAYDITKYGEENLLIVRRPNEIFPLIWAANGQDRHIIYQALSPASVLQVTRTQFVDYIHSSPDAMVPLLDITIEMYRIHSERILNLEYRSVRERLISFLITMSQRFGRVTDTGTLIDVPLRHQDIASSINATRETTSRELAGLERKGWLTTSQSCITLLDLDALKTSLR
ncbi:MAG: CarD family transcriptional regulator [Candidatus Saccharibacteria bacterium]|nr:CarD family transcriptional regulator [Candidatus Saccharibacteria bacterium]